MALVKVVKATWWGKKGRAAATMANEPNSRQVNSQVGHPRTVMFCHDSGYSFIDSDEDFRQRPLSTAPVEQAGLNRLSGVPTKLPDYVQYYAISHHITVSAFVVILLSLLHFTMSM